MPAPGKPALHSSDRVYSRNPTALPPIARPSPGGTHALHLQPTLATIAMPHAGSHALALTAPTTRPAVGLRALALPPPQVAGSTQHAPAGYAPFPHSRAEPPAQTHGWSATSRSEPPPLLAPFPPGSCR